VPHTPVRPSSRCRRCSDQGRCCRALRRLAQRAGCCRLSRCCRRCCRKGWWFQTPWVLGWWLQAPLVLGWWFQTPWVLGWWTLSGTLALASCSPSWQRRCLQHMPGHRQMGSGDCLMPVLHAGASGVRMRTGCAHAQPQSASRGESPRPSPSSVPVL
jgi:hypothetical protein